MTLQPGIRQLSVLGFCTAVLHSVDYALYQILFEDWEQPAPSSMLPEGEMSPSDLRLVQPIPPY